METQCIKKKNVQMSSMKYVRLICSNHEKIRYVTKFWSLITIDKFSCGSDGKNISWYSTNVGIVTNDSSQCAINQSSSSCFGKTSLFIFVGEKEPITSPTSFKLIN